MSELAKDIHVTIGGRKITDPVALEVVMAVTPPEHWEALRLWDEISMDDGETIVRGEE
jgi:hypothetical protein